MLEGNIQTLVNEFLVKCMNNAVCIPEVEEHRRQFIVDKLFEVLLAITEKELFGTKHIIRLVHNQKMDTGWFINNLYVDQAVKIPPKPGEERKVVLFGLQSSMTDEELHEEYRKRGLSPVHPDILIALNTEYPFLYKEYRNATHWAIDGVWYYACFYESCTHPVFAPHVFMEGRIGSDPDDLWLSKVLQIVYNLIINLFIYLCQQQLLFQ